MSTDTSKLTQDVQDEVLRLLEQCKQDGLLSAAGFFFRHNQEIVEIAVSAKLEPKTRDLPSPFVYSMQ